MEAASAPRARPKLAPREASALPGTTSRYIENRTTHAADFKAGGSDRVYLAKIAAVEGRDVITSGSATFAYVPGIVGGNVTVFNTSTYALVSAIATNSKRKNHLPTCMGSPRPPTGIAFA